MRTSLQLVAKPKLKKPRELPALGTGKRTVTSIGREIKQLERTLERANKDFFRASRAIAERGVSAVKTVTDSKGYSFKALRVSANVRILEAASKTRRVVEKNLVLLREELQRLQAPKQVQDDTDNFFATEETETEG
jgi:hypothetical protein